MATSAGRPSQRRVLLDPRVRLGGPAGPRRVAPLVLAGVTDAVDAFYRISLYNLWILAFVIEEAPAVDRRLTRARRSP